MSIITGVNNQYTFYYSGMETDVYPHTMVASGSYSGVAISGVGYVYHFDGNNIQKYYCCYLRDLLSAAQTKIEG
jgi:hypothetical protein